MSIASSIADFQAAVDRESSDVLAEVPKYLQRVAMMVIKEMLAITPVDTGHAKANWQIGIDNQPMVEINATDNTPVGVVAGPTFASAMAVIGSITLNTKVVWVVNNSDYISRIVEYGHSTQAAPGAFSAALQRIESRL